MSDMNEHQDHIVWRAQVAMLAWGCEVEGRKIATLDQCEDGDKGGLLSGLLTDLRHWAAHNDLEFDECVEVSADNFESETNPDNYAS